MLIGYERYNYAKRENSHNKQTPIAQGVEKTK
jgi:hypothetical protein